jgi:hypothetical protein
VLNTCVETSCTVKPKRFASDSVITDRFAPVSKKKSARRPLIVIGTGKFSLLTRTATEDDARVAMVWSAR